MQTNNSFLKWMKDNVDRIFSVKVSRYKDLAIIISYILVITLVLLHPTSMNLTDSSKMAMAQVIPGARVEEETADAAIIQTNNKNDFLTEVEGIQLLQMQTGNEQVKEIVLQKMNSANQGAVELQADDIVSKEIHVSEEIQSEKNNTKNNTILIDKVAGVDIAGYINVTEAKEEAALAEKAEEVAVRAAEQRLAEQAAAEKKAAEEAAKAEAERKAAEEAEIKKAEQEAMAAVTAYKSQDISSSDIGILERIVEAEATGEDIKGKILVANVVMNRVNSKTFPNSIEGVVFQKRQFSPIADGRYYSVTVTNESKEAVSRALQGEDYSQGALYFAARPMASEIGRAHV